MNSFTAIDFETGNPGRVSACAIGFAVVENSKIVLSDSYLIKPIGGHAPFQTKIHGITDEQTKNKPMFNEIYPQIKKHLNNLVVGHSLFDKQVLLALSDYFSLNISFQYLDSSTIAKEKIPGLTNYKLTTIAKHLNLNDFKHHDAKEDAITCANIVLKLNSSVEEPKKKISFSTKMEFRGLIFGIISDEEINYKEAFSLLYWLQDHSEMIEEHSILFNALDNFCSDLLIDKNEERILLNMLKIELKKMSD